MARERIGYATEAGPQFAGRVLYEGVNERWEVDYRVIGVPSPLWLGAAERSQGRIRRALLASNQLWDRDLVVASSTVITLEGSGPLIPSEFLIPEGAEQAYETLCLRLMARGGDKRVLNGEISSGVAVFSLGKMRGLLGEVRIPISVWASRTYLEIDKYLRALANIVVLENLLIMPQLEGQQQAFTPDLMIRLGQIARNWRFLAREHRQELDNFFESGEEELRAGLFITQDFPGGIYLAALVGSGRLKTINGFSPHQLDDYRLGQYILLARDANAPAIGQLMEALETDRILFEIVYTHGPWTKVFLEGRRGQYPLYKFYLAEEERLSRSPDEIWADESLPPKVKRQLMLEKLGIEINPHLHVPIDVFFDDGREILAELWEMWRMPIGASSALFSETALGKMPSTRFNPERTEETEQALNEYRERLAAFPSKDGKEGFVILYPFVWEDENLVVGGSSRFDTPPQLAGEMDTTNWIIEMQKGRWPRGINRADGGYISFIYEGATEIGPGVFMPKAQRTIVRDASSDVTGEDHLLAVAELEAKRFTQSRHVQAAVFEIMRITGKKSVAIDWMYYRPTGRILAVDF